VSAGSSKRLRSHQAEAVRAAIRALTRLPRVTVVSATGTGKTIIGMRIAEHFSRRRGHILVLVPTLELLSQTATHWADDSNITTMVGVCSLPASQSAVLKTRMTTLTTDARVLAAAVASHTGTTAVFATYASLKVIQQAHRRHALPPWSIVIVDEAHRTSGELGKEWGAVHNDQAVPAQRRLYMTATPRTWTVPERSARSRKGPAKKTRATSRTTGNPDGSDVPLASMDDPAIYGPIVYRLELAEAIDRGILADYRIVVPVITDEELCTALQTPGISAHQDGLRLAALQLGLLRAMAEHRIRRVISFHSRVAYATHFAQTLPDTVDAAAPATNIRRLWVHAIHNRQSPRSRAWHLQDFASIPLMRSGPGPRHAIDGAVLSSVRVLGEGVDVPNADAVLFADPKRSASDIIQSLGRALRQPPGTGKIATLIIPVYVGKKQNTQDAMKTSDFRMVWEVLSGLREHDSRFYWRLAGRGSDRRMQDPYVTDPERADEIALVTTVRSHQIDHGLWAAGWAAATRFIEHHHHFDIPSEYSDSTGFRLGQWIGQQRSLYAAGSLAPEHALALNTLGISWPHPSDSFEHHLEQALNWAATSGTLAISGTTPGADPKLGRWLARMRDSANTGRLHQERVAALDAIDPWWNPPWDLQWQQSYIQITNALADPTWTPAALTPISNDDLHHWLDTQITHLGDLSGPQVRLLTQLAHRYPRAHPHLVLLNPTTPAEQAFSRGLAAARQYLHREGHLVVPHACTEMLSGQPVRLGRWLYRQRTNSAQLTPAQADALTALGIELLPVFLEPAFAPHGGGVPGRDARMAPLQQPQS
jgi:superfamily II DNA or RNA helicase